MIRHSWSDYDSYLGRTEKTVPLRDLGATLGCVSLGRGAYFGFMWDESRM